MTCICICYKVCKNLLGIYQVRMKCMERSCCPQDVILVRHGMLQRFGHDERGNLKLN